MAAFEQDTIKHLLEVEDQASEMIASAQEEAEKTLSAARAKADGDYGEKFRVMVSQMEGDFQKKINDFDREHKDSLDKYKEEISKTQKDTAAFESYLEKIL